MSISSRKMKITVTDASGFLGRNLIKMLRKIIDISCTRLPLAFFRSTNTDDHVRYRSRCYFTNNDEEIFYGSTVINAHSQNSNGTEMAKVSNTPSMFRIAHSVW